jgi:Glycosyl transferases group 1/Glycosyltransferase Family 4
LRYPVPDELWVGPFCEPKEDMRGMAARVILKNVALERCQFGPIKVDVLDRLAEQVDWLHRNECAQDIITGTSARLESLDHLCALYLPRVSPSITFRAYLKESNGRSLLDRCLERLTTGRPPEGVVVLYHDEIDGSALMPWRKRGVFIWQSNRESPVESLSELALAFPDRTIVVCSVEVLFAPDDVVDRALEHHALHHNHYTRIADLPPEASPEIFDPSVLGALFHHRFASNAHPGQVIEELALLRQSAPEVERLRVTPLLAENFYGRAELPGSVRLKTAYDVDKAETALKADSAGLDRLSRFQIPTSLLVFPTQALPPKSRRPRVLYFSPSCGFSGAEQSLVQVIKHIGNECEQVAVVGFEGMFEQKLKERNCFTYAPNVDLREPTAPARQLMRDILEWSDPDVVHSNGDPGTPMLEALREANLPLVQHARIIEVETLLEPMRQACAVIAISRYTKAAVERLGIDPGKITPIYNSVDTQAFFPGSFDKSEMRQVFGIPADAVCVLMIARQEISKRHDLFIESAASVAARCPEAWFALAGEAGDCEWEHHLSQMIRQRGLDSRLAMAGFVPDIRTILAASDVLVLPADGEPLGRCVLEAMAMGLPAIVTDNGGSCELVDHDVTGLVVPHGNAEALGQAMLSLVQNEHTRLMFGAAGRRAAEARFEARDCARSISALFRNVARLQ